MCVRLPSRRIKILTKCTFDCCGRGGVRVRCWFLQSDDLPGAAHKQPVNVRGVARAEVQTLNLLPPKHADRLVLWAGSPPARRPLRPLPTRPEVGNQTNYGCI